MTDQTTTCGARTDILLDGRWAGSVACSMDPEHGGWHQLERDGSVLFVWQGDGTDQPTEEQKRLMAEATSRRFWT